MNRGEIWLVNLGPIQGAEQAGQRPALIFQNDQTIGLTGTIIVVLITSNVSMARLATGYLLRRGEGGLHTDSVALCHQIRAADKKKLLHRIGKLSSAALTSVQLCVAATLGM